MMKWIQAEHKPGVYEVKCSANGKVYIGSSRKSVKKRLSQHICELRKGTHISKRMQEDFVTHGESSFSFRVVSITEPEAAYDVEYAEIVRLNATNPECGYNIEEDARFGGKRSGAGRPVTDAGTLPARQFGRVNDSDWQTLQEAFASVGFVKWALPTLLAKAMREKKRSGK